jgi:hypothetical protein
MKWYLRGKPEVKNADNWGMKTALRLNFSEFADPGRLLSESGKNPFAQFSGYIMMYMTVRLIFC